VQLNGLHGVISQKMILFMKGQNHFGALRVKGRKILKWGLKE
jgi:hypothetical protein